MTLLIIGLVLFLGLHSLAIVSPAGRDRLAARFGPQRWQGVFSLLSAVGLVLLIYGYGVARQHPVLLYVPPAWTRHLTATLMLVVFPLIFATYFPGRIKAAVKHPMMIGTVIWAAAHLLANGMLADALLFGGFLLWSLAQLVSYRFRTLRPLRAAPPSNRNDAIAISLGLLVYLVLVLWVHRLVIGVAPLPI